MSKLLTKELFQSFRNDADQLQDASWEEETDQQIESFPDYLTMNPAEIPPFLLQHHEESNSPVKERPPLLYHSIPEREDTPEVQETDEMIEESLQTIQAETYAASITMRLIDDLFHQQMVEFKDKENPLSPLLQQITISNFENDFEQEFIPILQDKIEQTIHSKDEWEEEQEEQLLETYLQEEEDHRNELSLSSFRLHNEILQSELQKCKLEYSKLVEQEVSKTMTIDRLQQEIKITQQYMEKENQSFSILLQSLDSISEKMANSGTIRQYEQEPNSTLTWNILQYSNTLQTKSEELKSNIEMLHCLEEEKRRRQIQFAHSEDMYKQQLIHEEKWAQESFQLEKNANRELSFLTREVEEKRKRLEVLIKSLDFIKYDEDFVIRSFERLVNMLKGKEELPNNNYISVKKAIFLYSKLKDATNRNVLNREYINQLLKENIEFNILLPLSETQSAIDQLIKEEQEVMRREEAIQRQKELENQPQNQIKQQQEEEEEEEDNILLPQQQQQQVEDDVSSGGSTANQLQETTKRKMSEKLQLELHSMDTNVQEFEDDDSILSDESLEELQQANQAIAKFTLMSPQILRSSSKQSSVNPTPNPTVEEVANADNSSNSSNSSRDEEEYLLNEELDEEDEEEDSNEEQNDD